MSKRLILKGRLTVEAFREFCPEGLEDDEVVFKKDPLRCFIPLEEIPADRNPWNCGEWVRQNAHHR